MAGFYPDVPGPRMAYDRDGSAGFRLKSGDVTSLTQSEMEDLNDESHATGVTTPDRGATYGVIFPELRDIAGYFLSWEPFGDSWTAGTVETSPNTTNGLDGTWTSRGSGSVSSSTQPEYRSQVTTLAVSGVKGIRVTFTQNTGPSHGSAVYEMHFFGSIASGENPDRLRFWLPTTDAEIDGAYFDYGEVGRGSTSDVTFRIKNNSASITATDIDLSVEALTDTTPSVPPQFELSDGGAFGPTLTIASLAPGALSSVLTVRRTTPSDASLALWAARLVAVSPDLP